MIDLTPIFDWTPRQPDESLDHYGQRALQFVLAFMVIDSLTLEDLEQADRAAMIAVTAKGISDRALDILSNCRRRIQLLIIERRLRQADSTSLPPVHKDKENLGPMARLLDRPITEPPSGSHADRAPVLRDRPRVDVGF